MSALRFSVPGMAPRLIADPDPFSGLTPRQRDVLAAVRAHNGNRSRAARELGVTTAAVQHVIRIATTAGARVPRGATRGPNSVPRPLAPRCPLPVAGGPCGRGAQHPGSCVSVGAWQRRRAA
jgi:hypothetical protein